MESDEKYEKLVEQYKLSCEVCGTHPDLKFCKQFGKGELVLDIFNIDMTTLDVLCHLLSQSLTPPLIKISSSSTDNKTNDEKKTLQKLFQSLSVTLKKSKAFFDLIFVNIVLLPSLISVLGEGLSVTRRLRSLSFISCNLKHAAMEGICSAIKNVACIATLTFDNCQIDYKGFQFINSLVMHQCLNRTSLMWKDTLRTEHPNVEKITGLRYLLLNNNPLIGDEGVKNLTDALADDIWMTGIELENCGITSGSSEAILELLKVNKVLKCLSLKNNPFLQSDFLTKIDDIFQERNPTPIVKPLVIHTYVEKVTPKKVNRRHQRISLDETLKSKVEIPEKLKNLSIGVPWRIEGRLIEREEGLPIGTLSFILEEIRKAKMRKKLCVTEEEIDLGISIQNIRNVLHFYKSKCKTESKRRIQAENKAKRLERKLNRYQEVLSKNYILDEDTFLHVEQCFSSFQNFLMKLQKVGYVNQNDIEAKLSESSKFSSISVASPKIQTEHPIKSKSSSRHSSTSHASKNSVKNSISSKDSKTMQTVFNLPKYKFLKPKKEDSSEKSSKKSSQSMKKSISTERSSTSGNDHSDQKEAEQSGSEGKVKNNSYSEEFDISVGSNTNSNRNSQDSKDKGSSQPEESENVIESSSRSSQNESIAEEVRSTKSSTDSNHSRYKDSVNKTFNKRNNQIESNEDKAVEDESNLAIEDNSDDVIRNGGKSFNIDSTSNEIIYSPRSNSERSEGGLLNSSASVPFNVKNIRLVPIPLNSSADEPPESNTLCHVATDDEKLNKMVAESLSRRNSRRELIDPESQNEISNIAVIYDTAISLHESDIGSNSKLSIGADLDSSTNDAHEDNSAASLLFSFRNSRQPSVSSISEQLSFSHEKWSGNKFRKSNKSKSRHKRNESGCEGSESGDSVT